MNAAEKRVLRFLVEETVRGAYASFAPIMRRTRLSRKVARRACRSLARKGLASFRNGLWTEDGDLYGSGYMATEAGHSIAQGTSAAMQSSRSSPVMASGTAIITTAPRA